MKKFLLALVALTFLAVNVDSQEKKISLEEGHYNEYGRLPNDKEGNEVYYDTMLSVEKRGDGYTFRWIGTQVGVGILKGNTLSVSWSDGKSFGVSVFEWTGKVWRGTWTGMPSDVKERWVHLEFVRPHRTFKRSE